MLVSVVVVSHVDPVHLRLTRNTQIEFIHTALFVDWNECVWVLRGVHREDLLDVLCRIAVTWENETPGAPEHHHVPLIRHVTHGNKGLTYVRPAATKCHRGIILRLTLDETIRTRTKTFASGRLESK